jgi:hypothetical protein
MSHFTVAVLVRQDRVPEPGHPDFACKLTAVVEEMLAPFDEGMRVKPYPLPCSCAEDEASRQAKTLAEQETGLSWSAICEDWRFMSPENRSQTTWEEFAEPFLSVWQRHTESLLTGIKHDEACEDCHGTGTRWSRYNKLSKWDWYSIGGRYSNRYAEKCIPTVIDNVAFARDLHSAGYAPFALLTPREPHQKQRHDNWNEQGQMGWFAIVSDENDNWPAIALELLDKYSGCFAVLMDCHI